ncbi:GTP binding protein [Aureococcus anophagefferens]|nr:GTP binding protein [Aureococcus anophagefferens]
MSRALLLLLACSLVRIDGFVAPPRPAPTIQLYAEDGPSRRGRRRARKERTHLTTPTEAAAPAAPAPKKAIPRPSVLDGIGTPSPKKLKQRTAQPPEAAAAAAASAASDAAATTLRRAAPPAFEIYDSAPDERAADAPSPRPRRRRTTPGGVRRGLYNPAKLDDVDDLLAKYAGREALLLSAVEGKYSGAGAIPLFKDEAAVMQGARLMEEYDARAREARAASAARLAAAAAAAAAAPPGDAAAAALRGAVLEAAATNLDGAAALAGAPEEFAWPAANVFAARDGVDAALAAAFRDAAAEAYARDGPAAAAAFARAAPAHRGDALAASAVPRRRGRSPAAPGTGPWSARPAPAPRPRRPTTRPPLRRRRPCPAARGASTSTTSIPATAPSPSGPASRSSTPGAGFAGSDAAALEDGGLARPGVAEAAGGKQDSWRSLTARYLDVRDSLAVVLQLVDARRCLDGALPAADAATLDAVAGSRAADAARHVLVLTKVDKLKPRSSTAPRRRSAPRRCLRPARRRAAVVRTAATARPPVGRADLWREILAGLDAAS